MARDILMEFKEYYDNLSDDAKVIVKRLVFTEGGTKPRSKSKSTSAPSARSRSLRNQIATGRAVSSETPSDDAGSAASAASGGD